MPVFNRERLVERAVRSCLDQSFTDFELVVVDDGSIDQSCARVAAFADPRIRLLRQAGNRGVGPARNAGVAHAHAEWLVMLDSDDELVAGALATVAARAAAADADIGSLWFRCRLDDGSLSPGIEPVYGRRDYPGYLQYLESCAGTRRDMLYCPRRSTFRQVVYPDSFGLEDCYHLDFNRRFASLVCADVLRLYHQDADNQLVRRTARFDPARDRQFALDRADVIEAALRGHGAALRAHAPRLLAEYESRLLTLSLLCGRRGRAAASLLRILATRSGAARAAALFAVGVWHPTVLAGALSASRSIARRRAARTRAAA